MASAAAMTSAQPTRKRTPPIGTIAPRILTPDRANAARQPLKISVPMRKHQPAACSRPRTGDI